MTALTDLPAALAAIAPETRVEHVPFAQALHRRCATAVRLESDRPPRPLATGDGYAIRSDELDSAVIHDHFAIVGASRDGQMLPPLVRPGTCVQVEAGSAVPAGCVVVATADCVHHGDHMRLRSAVSAMVVTAAGCDARAETVLIQPLQTLDPGHQALAGWAGLEEVAIIAPPRVALLTPEPDAGADALGPLLMAFSLGWNLPASRHRLPSDHALRTQAIANAADRAKVVVVCADGWAAESAETALGFAPLLPAMAIDRGAAAIGRRASGVLLIDLPTDPGACLVAIHLLLWPVLARVLACPPPRWHSYRLGTAPLLDERRNLIPVVIDGHEAVPVAGGGLQVWAQADGVALIDAAAAISGSIVSVLRWAHRI